MNYPAFTNDSLTMLYEASAGPSLRMTHFKRQGMEIRFRVRETPEWKLHAAELDTEMLQRGMYLNVIDWSEDQATLPFEGWSRRMAVVCHATLYSLRAT
jgi:hypothetical protein